MKHHEAAYSCQLLSNVQESDTRGHLEVLKALVAATQPLLPEGKETESCGDQEQHGAKSSDFGRPESPQGLKVPAASNCIRPEFGKQI